MKAIAIICVASLSASQGFIPGPQFQDVIVRTQAVVDPEVANAALPGAIMLAGFAASVYKAEEDAKESGTDGPSAFLSKLSAKKSSTSEKETNSVPVVEIANNPEPDEILEEKESKSTKTPAFFSKIFSKSEAEEVTKSISDPTNTESGSGFESDVTPEETSKDEIETSIGKVIDEISETLTELDSEVISESEPEENSKTLSVVPSMEEEPELSSKPVSVNDFSQLKGQVASTLENETEKMKRLQTSIEEEEKANEATEASEEEFTAELETITDEVTTTTKKRGFFRFAFRVLKKVVAPWRKWKNIS